MNLKKEITVGIPYYNSVDVSHLCLCIDSILNQTFKPQTIHLIQDGKVSKDITKKINFYIKNYPDLFILLKLPKKGLPYALNQSIKLSKTKYYARMDSDDISVKNRLEIQINHLEEKTHIDILGSWAYEFESDYKKKNLFINKTPKELNKIKEYIHYRNPIIHPSVIFRTHLFKKIGYYNEKMLTDQDLELWGRALNNNISITNIQKPLIFLRTQDRFSRRSNFSAIKRQIIIRYSFNTLSLKLNVLKLMAIILRLLPFSINKWAYKYLRNFKYEN